MFKDLIPLYTIFALSLMSPGPDFAIILKNSIAGQKKAMFSVLGVTCGIAVHIAFSLFGLSLIIEKSKILAHTIETLGTCYLAYLGFKILLNSKKKTINVGDLENPANSKAEGFKEGFVTNILNPKAGMFILSLFSQMIHAGQKIQSQMVLGALIVVSTGLWFSSVALFLNNPSVRKQFLKYVPQLEKLMGVILIAFAAYIFSTGIKHIL